MRHIRHGLVNKLSETTQRIFQNASNGSSNYSLPSDFSVDAQWADVLASLGDSWTEEAAKQFAYVAVLFSRAFRNISKLPIPFLADETQVCRPPAPRHSANIH